MKSFFLRVKFWLHANRLGPDMPLTHWLLYFNATAKWFCCRRFGFFANSASVRPGSYIVNCHHIYIGDRVVIRPGTHLFASEQVNGVIKIGDGVLIGGGVHIYVSNHEYRDVSRKIIDQGHSSPKSVVLEEGCWIGAGVIILPGVTVGRNAVVGAGSVVTKSVLPFGVYAGNPAKFIKRVTDD
ncbi:acyltransferase [Pseudomonas caspiana]|uniref:acyltransferase n=1 Tax=Pseudomonas caspiana TaxID=1451454 RepID=UPI0032EEF9A3